MHKQYVGEGVEQIEMVILQEHEKIADKPGRICIKCIVGNDEEADQNQDVIRRVDLEAPANEKSYRLKRTLLIELVYHQPGDEKAAQYEKQVDAHPADVLQS